MQRLRTPPEKLQSSISAGKHDLTNRAREREKRQKDDFVVTAWNGTLSNDPMRRLDIHNLNFTRPCRLILFLFTISIVPTRLSSRQFTDSAGSVEK